MAQITKVLEFLKTLIHSTDHDIVNISKKSLSDIITCLRVAQEKNEFLQLESQLQREELKHKSHHFEPVSVQNIEMDSHQQQEYRVEFDSHSMPSSSTDMRAGVEIQSALPKPIIRPWEELVHNKHKTSLGYDKELSFHILDYSKLIKFQSVKFLHDSSPTTVLDSAPLPQQQQ